MTMNNELKYIGKIKTPYKSIAECPKNISFDGPECELVIDQEYAEGLMGLSVNDRIMILYWFEHTNRDINIQKLRGVGEMRGTFSLRSPHRPNPIGAAVVEIKNIQKNVVTVVGLDCLNGTRILDIKPAIYDEQ